MVRRAFGVQRGIRLGGGSANPPFSSAPPSALLSSCEKSRSCEVTRIRHRRAGSAGLIPVLQVAGERRRMGRPIAPIPDTRGEQHKGGKRRKAVRRAETERVLDAENARQQRQQRDMQ